MTDVTDQAVASGILGALIVTSGIIGLVIGVAWDRGHRIHLDQLVTWLRPATPRPITAAELNAIFQPPHRPQPKPCTTCGQTGPCVTASGARARQPHRPRWAVAA